MQVVAITLKNVVLLDANLDEQIAGWSTVGAGLTVAGAANAHAIVDAGWDFDFQCFLLLQLALTVAHIARVGDDLARASAVWTGLLHAEKALAHLHLTAAVTGATGFD